MRSWKYFEYLHIVTVVFDDRVYHHFVFREFVLFAFDLIFCLLLLRRLVESCIDGFNVCLFACEQFHLFGT